MTTPVTNVRQSRAATARFAAGSGVIDHPHPGQNAAFAGISVPQCGHCAEVCAGFAAPSAELFAGLDNSASIRLLAAGLSNPLHLESVAARAVEEFSSPPLVPLPHSV